LDDHDDHRRVNELLLTIDSHLKTKPKEVWAYQIYSSIIPNVVVDITAQVEVKEKAMRLLNSVKGERDWAHYVLGMNAMNCRFLPTRKTVYGETFFVVPWQEYLDLCQQYFSNGAEKVYYNPVYRTK
jgi:LmbE family N-acetylglucosaminyl deacetylase